MIRQVRMFDTAHLQAIFAFGTHPLADPTEVANNNQMIRASSNALLVVMDELLVGNHLEEIACRGPVDDDSFGRVPVGATPDDIARCSGGDDVLGTTCTSRDKNSVCLCTNPAGCLRGTTTVPEGQPVGVLDLNMDGAADNTRAIAGAVGIRCGDAIDVPIDLDLTYWNPSGDQNKPAMGGFDALGPKIVVAPGGALPTNVECGLVMSADVVDKQGEKVCAPADGNIDAGCAAGDLSAFRFKIEALSVEPATFNEGETGVNKAAPLVFETNAPVDAASLVGVQISPAATLTITAPTASTVRIDVTGGLAPMTMYTLTFPVTIKDRYAQPLAAPLVFHFTTGA